MKWLVVLLILLIVVALVAYRYRKQLQTALFMYRTVKKMRKSAKAAKKQKEVPPRDTSMDSELVQCPNCGKYSAMNETVKLKGEFYCSHQCMEESLAVLRSSKQE